jgi:hypothetical protein
MTGMRKIEKPSPTESPLLFEVDPQPAEELLTALGGLPLVVQAFRSLGLPGVKQHVVVKERQRGYDEATFVESFVLLNAAGGECLGDFEHLRADLGLAEIPSSEAARNFLYAFHEEEKIEQAKQQRLPDQIAYIPEDSEALAGLGKVNQELIRRFGERCPEQKIATVDQVARLNSRLGCQTPPRRPYRRIGVETPRGFEKKACGRVGRYGEGVRYRVGTADGEGCTRAT